MRRAQKQEILNLINSLHKIHEKIKGALEQKNLIQAQELISETQEAAISIGNSIEEIEGEGHITVSLIEEYCELLFCVYEDISKNDFNVKKAYKMLRKQLIEIENSVKNDISVRIEVAFFPYKASMWDSLESIYLAAKADPDCDAYCVPIPYYTLNPDLSFGQMHYEGDEYPEDIEITDWQEYHFEERRPDVIYFHNPYDNYNGATSVHPRFYSSELRKYTDTLVYIPYYCTSGGMSEGQRYCSAYMNIDYFVIQSPEFRKYYDENIPDRKFLPFGSPKFDRIIRKCQNPPVPPREWQEKMAGKRVYFYNTSINGMLEDTENFLKKMQYVFDCFEERDDVCILWRPHPLLESAIQSMRPEYLSEFQKIQRQYIEKGIGIFDTSVDIDDSIALCDAYIGDDKTSVTALFGVVGKPVFILNNWFHKKRGTGDWRGKIHVIFDYQESDQFMITQGNKLYVSAPGKYDYRYFCDLSDSHSREYDQVLQIDGKRYACPSRAQNILVIGDNGVERVIELKKEPVDGLAFIYGWKYDRFLILLPLNYPALIRFDTVTGECLYVREHIDVYVKEKTGCKITGGSDIYQGSLFLSSPTDNKVCKFDIERGEMQVIEIPIQSRCGCYALAVHKDEFWMLPYRGNVIVRWNPKTGETMEYTDFPDGFSRVQHIDDKKYREMPFSSMAFYGDHLYLTPQYANMPLRLDVETGQFTQWKLPFEVELKESRIVKETGHRIHLFTNREPENGSDCFNIYAKAWQRLYKVNFKTDTWEEIKINFDMKELQEHDAGFQECEYSGVIKYAIYENKYNSLIRFLDDMTMGNSFDSGGRLLAYREITANIDGSCGRKVYEYIKEQG